MLFWCVTQVQRTDLTFVRHAETVANATGRYNGRTLNAISPKGLAEIKGLTKRLDAMPLFDMILVSPSPRVLKTIAPYLRDTHQVATIWPLLYECCTGRRPANAHATAFRYGAKITLPAAIARYFRIEPSESRYPVAPEYDQGLAQVAAAVKEFNARCRGHRVLLVGHSGEGGHMLRGLTGHWIRLANATPLHVELP